MPPERRRRPRSGGGAASGADRTIVPMRLDPNPPRPRPVHQPGRPERDLSRPLPSALSWTVLATFAAALAIAIVAGGLSWWILAWYGALSAVAFVAYGLDKSAAKRGAPRTSESRPAHDGVRRRMARGARRPAAVPPQDAQAELPPRLLGHRRGQRASCSARSSCCCRRACGCPTSTTRGCSSSTPRRRGACSVIAQSTERSHVASV